MTCHASLLNEERLQEVYIFCRLKACPISFELCCRNYIFQVLIIDNLRYPKKKRRVRMHKTTNAQTSEISRLI